MGRVEVMVETGCSDSIYKFDFVSMRKNQIKDLKTQSGNTMMHDVISEYQAWKIETEEWVDISHLFILK